MKHRLPSLDALKVFEAAARHLSFTLAAQELYITKGAVSYQIRKLESSLDCALFRRAVRQVYLTNAGQELLQTVQGVFTQLNRTLEQIRPGDSSYDVLIGATTYVAMRWLSPLVSEFSARHPQVSILLQHPVNPEEFNLQEVDFAIRWCAMDGQQSRKRPFEMPMPLFPVCSPGLLERFEDSTRFSILSRMHIAQAPLNNIPLLCEDRSLDLWQAWYGQQTVALDNPRRIIADANVRTQAAIDGQGWTMADQLMQREMDSGALVAPFRHRLEGYGYAIQASPGRFLNQNASELRDWLLKSLRKQD